MADKKDPKPREGEKLVVFTKLYMGWNAGERVTFKTGRANQLIEAGVAQEPSVLRKLAEAMKKAARDKGEKHEPAVGKLVKFHVEGLGETNGHIENIPPGEGPITVKVGEDDDADLYEVERAELVVLE